jgi:hypothetical protein
LAIPTWTFELVSLKIYVKLLSNVKILIDEKKLRKYLDLARREKLLGVGN